MGRELLLFSPTVRHSSESEAILQDLEVELSKERMVLTLGGQDGLWTCLRVGWGSG